MQAAGCCHALCGFSGDRTSLEILRQVRVNYLKIDGGLILNMKRSAVDLARVKAIQRVAHAIGITTIAECVEDDETIEQLRSIGVHFAQGFGISRPRDLQLISAVSKVEPADEPAIFDAVSAMAAE
jgi:EAL domain-containing protein (putative c-di-GMP-specific phosphodiesterase class I)